MASFLAKAAVDLRQMRQAVAVSMGTMGITGPTPSAYVVENY